MEFDRATGTAVDLRLQHLIAATDDVAVTEPIVMEVLAGARDDRRERELRRLLDRFVLVRFEAATHFAAAARLYSRCRSAGVTPRGLIDCAIAAVALDHDLPILAGDADLARLAGVVGLRLDEVGADGR